MVLGVVACLLLAAALALGRHYVLGIVVALALAIGISTVKVARRA